MICSAKELGINDKLLPKELQEGILVLPEDTQIGATIAGRAWRWTMRCWSWI